MDRRLGNYERYSLSRTLIGMTPALSFVASLPITPDPTTILVAVTTLLKRHPLLSCVVSDTRTTRPRFETRAILADEVVRVETKDRTVEEALLFGLQEAANINVEEGPLWKVVLLIEQGRAVPSRLVLAVNHVVSDGAGTKQLLAELLALIFHTNSSPLAGYESPTGLAPTMEVTVDVRPPWLLVLREVFNSLIAPRLPSIIRPSQLGVYPSPPLVPPHTRPTAVRLATFPSTLVTSLKAVCAANAIATLHPIFHSCLLVSLIHTSSALPGSHHFTTATAISLRDEKLHPPVTGNYVASLLSSYLSSPPSPSISLSSNLWDITREYARRLVDPTERLWAKGTMGMMAYIPDGVHEEETGWEVFLRQQLLRENPWTVSAGLSNLGAMKVPEGVDVAWVQAAQGNASIEFNVSPA